MMKKIERRIVFVVGVLALCFGISPVALGMHIMEGYLSPVYCVTWGIISLPFLIGGYFTLKRLLGENHRNIVLIAMAGAFIFVISSLKIPSVTGSCSHMTGTGLGAILFGPLPMSILGAIVLLFQALLLAHGGVTTLGANIFSMAIAGPFLAYVIYRLGLKLKVNKYVAIFLAAALGDIFTYCVTSFQLGIAYPSEVGGVMASLGKFLLVFAPTQLPLAIMEGILTVLIMMGLEKYASEELSFLSVKGAK